MFGSSPSGGSPFSMRNSEVSPLLDPLVGEANTDSAITEAEGEAKNKEVLHDI